jgi:hypothetical protein
LGAPLHSNARLQGRLRLREGGGDQNCHLYASLDDDIIGLVLVLLFEGMDVVVREECKCECLEGLGSGWGAVDGEDSARFRQEKSN